MTKKFLTFTLIGATFFTSLNVFAAPDDQRFNSRDDKPRQEHMREDGPRHDDRDRSHCAQRDERSSQWRKGQRVPDQYKNSRYYVNDWKNRSLPEPPRGKRWIKVNGDYILIAVATGVISSVLFNQH